MKVASVTYARFHFGSLTIVPLAIVFLTLQSVPAAAQTPPPRDRAQTPANAAGDDRDAALARGWNALAGGKPEAAIAAADAILKTRPWDHGALLLKIDALSGTSPVKALDAYEAWLGARRVDDLGLLEPIAGATLRELSAHNDQVIRLEALRQLTACGSTSARAALVNAQANVVADAELVKLGDANALERLKTGAAAEGVNKPAIANALASAGAAGLPTLIKLSSAPDVTTRIAAIGALAKMRAEPARGALQRGMTDSDPMVRAWSAVGLARLQDAAGLAQVDKMLNSNVPDLQLLAAEAWDGESGPWVAALRPLLANRDGLVRFQAARLMAPIDPDAARQVFSEGLSDANPVVRVESARLVAQTAGERPDSLDLPRLRQMLRTSDATIRLTAAVAILSGICHRPGN
jgi:HEAT repeat protein